MTSTIVSLPHRCAPLNQTVLAGCRSLELNSTSAELYTSGASALEGTQHYLLPAWLNLTVSVTLVVCTRLLGYLVLRYSRNPNREISHRE